MIDYKEVSNIVDKQLVTREPFSLIRIGDGEHMAMSQRKVGFVMGRQFNYLPEQKDLDYISKIVADAYTEADLIGVPTEHHNLHCGSYWARTQSYLEEVRPETKDILKCSIDVSTELLESKYLDKILKQEDKLIYISGRNLDEQFKNAFNIKDVQSFVVNPEQKWEADKKERSHYPDQFNKCVEWINNIDATDTLCLVGAGILGKYYSHLLKRRGGIVLEMGHVFDYWAGLKTRGAGRGIEAIDHTYKL